MSNLSFSITVPIIDHWIVDFFGAVLLVLVVYWAVKFIVSLVTGG